MFYWERELLIASLVEKEMITTMLRSWEKMAEFTRVPWLST
jgi:hypothetical protein